MGAAVLITLGVLFLLQELWVFQFGQSFPVFLIVVGVMMFLGRSASIEGHIQPGVGPGTTPPPGIYGDQSGPEVHS